MPFTNQEIHELKAKTHRDLLRLCLSRHIHDLRERYTSAALDHLNDIDPHISIENVNTLILEQTEELAGLSRMVDDNSDIEPEDIDPLKARSERIYNAMGHQHAYKRCDFKSLHNLIVLRLLDLDDLNEAEAKKNPKGTDYDISGMTSVLNSRDSLAAINNDAYVSHLYCLVTLTRLQLYQNMEEKFDLADKVIELIGEESQILLELAMEQSVWRIESSRRHLENLQSLASYLRTEQAEGVGFLSGQLRTVDELMANKKAQIKAYETEHPETEASAPANA
ncbi:MAG: hypothetical protein Q9169_008034 [Polycauliona sp. 2 TL-2023]